MAAGQGACMGPIEELHPRELQEMLERVSQEGAGDVQLIDVREDFEHQTASLPGFKLMPMSRQGSALLQSPLVSLPSRVAGEPVG